MKLFAKLKNNKLAESGANYSLSSSAFSIFSIFVSLLNMRWLGPSELGIWQSLCIVNAYVPFLQLGVQSGLNLELPILFGKNDEDKAKTYIANAYFLSRVVTGFIIGIGLVAAAIVWAKGLGPKYVLGIIAVTGLNVANSIAYHFIARYRSAMSFDILALIIRIQLLVAILSVPLVYYFGFWGLLIFSSLPNMVYAYQMYKRSPFGDVKPYLTKPDLRYLTKRGIIQMAFGQTSTAIKTFQQWFLLTFGGTVYVGLFNPALAIGNVVNLIPGQLGQFIVPQMGYKYGQTGMAKDLWPSVKKIFLFMPLAILPFSLVLSIILPWMIQELFPKYIESITAMQIMCFGFIFSCSSTTINFLYMVKAYKEASIILLTEFLCYLILPITIFKVIGASLLNAIAIGVSSTYIVLFAVTFFVMRFTLFKKKYNKHNENTN